MQAIVAADHPRIRGEHVSNTEPVFAGGGSSPHTRGARCAATSPLSRWRIIPAYAGSTPKIRATEMTLTDHPRIRGEHDAGEHGDERRPRIIPAYAGSTACCLPAASSLRDHPRIRGEHLASAPRARGSRGIIPAYAGSTVMAYLIKY